MQVQKDRKIWESSVYLPNMRPSGPVDYLFVGMEPSLGSWANTRSEAAEKIQQGFKNSMLSIGNFILHYCIRKYLCHATKYYITDLSKGAMRIEDASTKRQERWENWYFLFKDEFRVVTEKIPTVITIGQTPRNFLEIKNFWTEKGLKPHSILHHSNQAAGHRKDMAKLFPEEFRQFPKVSKSQILEIAKNILEESRMSKQLAETIMKPLKSAGDLTTSQQQLIFTYKVKFDGFRRKRHHG